MKLMKLAALAFAAAALPTFAQNPDTLGDIKKRGTIRFGYSETSVPFSYKNKDGEAGGYSVELCKRIANALQAELKLASLKAEWVPLTPASRVDAIASGKVDLECSTMSITVGRREKLDFSLPIFVDSGTLIAKGAVARSLADLQGKKIAVADKTTTLAALESQLKGRFISAEIVKTGTVAEGFELLKAGKVDALAGDRTVLMGTFLLGGGAEGIAALPEELSYEPYALGMRRGDSGLRFSVDKVLATIYRTGEIQSVYMQWLAPLGKPTPALLLLYALNGYSE